MKIGYACVALGVPKTNFKRCVLKNAHAESLHEMIAYNLSSLENLIDYNQKNHIHLFRISSDLIPFGSSLASALYWWEVYAERLKTIGKKIKNSGIRISMHPGQYTVLNSPQPGVVAKAIQDLNYHALVLDKLESGYESKIILHIGGVYQDKKKAKKRFIANYRLLSEAVQRRLVIENDDRSFAIHDVLDLGHKLNIPVVFDNLHHAVNSSGHSLTEQYWINQCRPTWKSADGCQKIHYSQQDRYKRPGAHSASVTIQEFLNFINALETKNIDIMLEVKDKNLSALKCINCVCFGENIGILEREWTKYRLLIWERSPAIFDRIQELLTTHQAYPAVTFYMLLEEALGKDICKENSMNAILYIWGELEQFASEKEQIRVAKLIENYKQGSNSLRSVKNSLWKLAYIYQCEYLLNSYYFL